MPRVPIDYTQNYRWIESNDIFNNMFSIFLKYLYDEPPLFGIYLTPSFNLTMSRILWGGDSENFLLDYYISCLEKIKSNTACTSDEECFLFHAQNIIKSSWMNAYVKVWAQDSASPYHHMAKRIIFELRLCLPDYLPDEFNF